MSIAIAPIPDPWQEFLAAHYALKAKRAAFDSWIDSVVMCDSFDWPLFRLVVSELDASHRLTIEKYASLLQRLDPGRP
ncbi:hypothetical protein [Variovorax sp. GB1P17]|uniref:hypothetical protein n=1 Tax=Variovorax sp. GB1P17 TaxID=3443740 RepID=UPI003F44CEE4